MAPRISIVILLTLSFLGHQFGMVYAQQVPDLNKIIENENGIDDGPDTVGFSKHDLSIFKIN